MATGYDISASAASGISEATPFYNSAGIYFDSNSSGGIDAGPNSSGAVTPTAARSITQAAPNAQPDNAVVGYAVPAAQVQSNSMLYYIIGGVALVGILIFTILGRK